MKTIQERLQDINNTIENSYKSRLTLKDGKWYNRHSNTEFLPVENEFINGPLNGEDSSNHLISQSQVLARAKEIYPDFIEDEHHNRLATVSQRAIGDDNEGFKIGTPIHGVGENIRGGIY